MEKAPNKQETQTVMETGWKFMGSCNSPEKSTPSLRTSLGKPLLPRKKAIMLVMLLASRFEAKPKPHDLLLFAAAHALFDDNSHLHYQNRTIFMK